MEWPKITESFLEVTVVHNYVKTLARAGKMKANIGAFVDAPYKTFNFTGGAKISNVMMKRNRRFINCNFFFKKL